ncbi:predicted protein [Thalassiosira pseudonana CCMP1335]|uniref:Uncharacterized protein n=1 Tax=Thalassiosira pseudonana TaxID=35128 RepID=B8BSR7_THAPS|nr:predicted protein [Thalassiosira pseudonana CCMP1335]EED95590.1 predicted protein [Thalassiosira pseudonana CCMP1335]
MDRRKSSEIARIEAPHNPDEEEAYLREAIKASLEDDKKIKGDNAGGNKPALSAEATDLLIDFMDDFDATGNTLAPAAAASGGNDWALAPAPQPANQWAAPPAAMAGGGGGWAMAPQPAAMAPPAPVQQQTYDQFGGGGAPPSNPFAPAPVQQQTYAAPAPTSDPFGYPQQAPVPTPTAAVLYGQQPASDPFAPQQQLPPAPAAAPVNAPAAVSANTGPLTMNSLSGIDGLLGAASTNGSAPSGTMADQALQNLMGSIDSFGITGSAAKPKNPFDNDVMSNATLGDLKSSKAGGDRKPVMNSPPGGALVPVGNQSGNWGGYGAQQQQQPQYNMGGSMGMQQQPPQYGMAGGFGQQQQPQMGYGQPQQMGQQPPMQQQYGMAPQYGQLPPMQQQQPQWGAPSYQ